MPEVFDWPGNLKISDRSDPMLVPMTRSGGMALNGDEQIISPLSARWEWSITVPIRTKDQARALRAILAQAKGRFNYLRVRVCDMYRISRREMGASPFTGEVPHSDMTYFSDGSGYQLSGGSAEIASTIAGQTSFTVDPGFEISSGTFFSIDDWLYVITDVDDADISPADGWVLETGSWVDTGYWLEGLDWAEYPPLSTTNRTIHFEPPIRESGGEEMLFNATAIWRLASDREGQLPLTIGKFGTVTINFVEPVGR